MIKTLTFWCPFIGNVGTVKAVLESAKAFSCSKGYKCKIINSYGEFDNYRQFLKENDIEEIILLKNRIIYKLPKEGFFWSRINYILIFFLGFLPLFNYIKKNKKDYLFIYLITSLPLLISALLNLKKNIIFRVSGRIKLTTLRKMIYFITKKTIKKVLVQTENSKKRVLKKNVFSKNKLKIIRDPIIDHLKINNLKKKKIEYKFFKKKYFVSIGRLTYQKNFLFLLKCLNEIKKQNNFLFLIIGNGEDWNVLKKYIKQYNLSKKVYLLGYKKNIYNYIHNSSGLICTSLWEEPGFVIQEAAACKKIILTSDCFSGPGEFVNYGKSGYIFKSNHQESFIRNFNLMLEQIKKHKKKININFKKTKLYTRDFFKSEIEKIL